jgi:serine/threonine-protein kinase
MRDPIPYGRYLLLERIAVGGMAEVWLAAERDAPDRRWAVKRLLPTLADDRTFVEMFLDEARLGAQLQHPGIVPVVDLGRVGESWYLCMELVAGLDLRRLLSRLRRDGDRLPVGLACWIALRAAEALDHAHRARDAAGRPLEVVHRDLSPANVLLGWDGSVRLIDFGIARAALRAHREDPVLRGKFAYLSPEQVRGLPVDRRADVFSLGAVLHELLTGERLFGGPTDLAVMERVRSAEAAPPSRANPGVPPALDALVLRALAREPADRFPWAADLGEALLAFARGADRGDLARLLAVRFPEEKLHQVTDWAGR